MESYNKFIDCLNHHIEPLAHVKDNAYASVLEKIGDKRFVLIGEATHGTEEFYQIRMEITKQLITEKGFMAVAIEADWPDVHGIHTYLQGNGPQEDAASALNGFKRFPVWMWRNKTMLPFLHWLRCHNDTIESPHKIGFYGLDIYSLNNSMQAVIDYLSRVDPEAAERAKTRYDCFDHTAVEPQTYGYLTHLGIKKPCINEAVNVLLEMQHNAVKYLRKDGFKAEEDYYFANENAAVIQDAEIYYRSMFENSVSSWNVRDRHMMATLNRLADHLEARFDKPAKMIVWAHNSHLGDARATEMSDRGEINLGQLVREQYGTHSYTIGFSTYEGTVTAASEWGGMPQYKTINPGIDSSYEQLFHQLNTRDFILYPAESKELVHYLQLPRLQRAIGVIYRPGMERLSHYYFTHLPYQFDCLIHIDKTQALKPLLPQKTAAF